MIKAILFDLDETLLDRDASIQAFLRGQYMRLADVLHPIPFDHFQTRFLLHDNYGYVAKEIVYSRLIDEFALQVEPARLIEDFYTNGWHFCILFPGVIELLQQLGADGYKIGIITNGSVRTQQPKIVNAGLSTLLDIALISEAEGVRKPDPIIFLRATQQLGVSPHESVMVGDNPLADIAGAVAVGMKTIWRRGYLPWPADLAVQPHHTIEGVTELLELNWQEF